MGDGKPDRAARKAPKRVTAARLRNIALAYVQRYGGSRARLQQVLTRRAERSLRYHGEVERKDEVRGLIDTVVADLCAQGMCDDRRLARSAAIEQSLAGRPQRVIRARLRMKGFGDADIDAALRAVADTQHEGAAEADWIACCRYARRRGLGPFRRASATARDPRRDLAAMMRAGFSYGHARRVMDAESAETLAEVIDSAALPTLGGGTARWALDPDGD